MTQLDTTLRELRLSGMADNLSVRLQEASANRLGHAEFMELILQDELNVRHQRHLDRRKFAARFHSLKTLEDFDWHFNSKLPRKELFDLATCAFIEERADVLFIGPPGLGQRQPPARAHDQPGAQVVLQLGDFPAHRRQRHAERS